MNTNCLEGLRCPKCKGEDDFAISGRAIFDVTDDGTDHFKEVCWEPDDTMWCRNGDCDYMGDVKDFTISEQIETCPECGETTHIDSEITHDAWDCAELDLTCLECGCIWREEYETGRTITKKEITKCGSASDISTESTS